ncbi:FERM domain-containing protein 8 [Aphelenchoides fujianensis]|nr:FERM domain-containing protein 8 [Aphelenchoides fujianensis]
MNANRHFVELKPLINQPAATQFNRSQYVNQDQNDAGGIAAEDLADRSDLLDILSPIRCQSDSRIDALARFEMHAADPQHYEKNRNLSQSRGIRLPAIKLEEATRPRSIDFDGAKRDYSPPITSSPVGYTLRHGELQAEDLNRSAHSESFNVANEEEDLVDIRIFFANGKAIQLSVLNGTEAMATDLLPLMAEQLEIDEEVANEALALWLVSPLLEVQLKPYHVAYEVRDKWPMFLRRFTTAKAEEIAFDEPLLVVRRNVQLSIPLEIAYQDEYERLTEVLYFDAKDEYMGGRYVVDVNTCVKLAALQLGIEHGPQDNEEDPMELIHDKLPELVPAHLLGRVKTFHLFGLSMMECKRGWEKQITDEYKTISVVYDSNHARRKAYLDIMRKLPCYGAAFFSGAIDRKPSSTVLGLSKRLFSSNQPQMDIRIGISYEYVTVVDRQRNELLLTRRLSDCSWFCSHEANDDDHEIPSFFLHFPDDEALTNASSTSGSGEHSPTGGHEEPPTQRGGRGNASPAHSRTSTTSALVSRLMQVFSKQSSMMDSLMNTLVSLGLGDFGSEEDVGSPGSSNYAPVQSEVSSPASSQAPTNATRSTNSSHSRASSAFRARFNDLPSPDFYAQYPSKLTKLALLTLDPQGQALEAHGSLKRIMQECQ